MVDVVSAEELVGALAREDNFDVLPGFRRDEIQGDEGRVCHWIVQIPDDAGDRLGKFLGGDHLHDVLGADGFRGFRGNVDFRIPFALETCGEGQQVRVVAFRERRNGRRVNSAGQEGSDGDVGTHVLSNGILEGMLDLRNLGIDILLVHRSLGEARNKPAMYLRLFTGLHCRAATGLQPTNPGVQGLRFGHILQVHVMLDRALIQRQIDVSFARHGE